jgi:hypothetical protein
MKEEGVTGDMRHGDTKVVKVEDGRGTSNALMMTYFDGAEEKILHDEGYRGEYIMFTIFAGPNVMSGYKARKIVRENAELNSNQGVGALIIAIKSNKELFANFDDGGTIGPDLLETIIDEYHA